MSTKDDKANDAKAVDAAQRKGPITRDDLVGGFQQLQETGDETAESVKSFALAAVAVVGVVVIGLVFLAGRKRGKRKSTVVEIRRF